MEIAHAKTDFAKVVGKILGGFFCQSGDENPLIDLDPAPAQLDCFVDLGLEWTDCDLGIQQACRADDLLRHKLCAGGCDIQFACGRRGVFEPCRLASLAEFVLGIGNPSRVAHDTVVDFKAAGRGAHIDELVCRLHELAKIQRTVVQSAGESESVFHQNAFAGAVPRIHAANLGHCGMGLVDDQKVILW